MKLTAIGILAALAGSYSEEQLRKEWQREWVRHDSSDPAGLKIETVTGAGFKFTLDASSGMNVGEMTGAATFEMGGQKAKALVGRCKVSFTIPIEEGFDSKLPVS